MLNFPPLFLVSNLAFDIIFARPQIALYPTPSQKVLFARPLAKIWSLTFFSVDKFVAMLKIGPRIFCIGVAI